MKAIILTIVILVVVGLAIIIQNIVIRHKGYGIPGKIAVRCSKGHVFRTVWIEGGE